MEKARPNRLIREKSPYLLQHAHNPVDWYPWGDEAFEEAAAKDRPIFLSIGYSTCHWCHVMERESFEDHEVAHLLNEAFVCIKVDREERPDLDHIYMTVCQMFTGAGGWPLTIVMTPDKHPFFAATYLPKQSRYGRAGLMELIPRIQTVWKDRRGEVLNSAARILEALAQSEQAESGEVDPGLELLDQAYAELARRFDDTYGGFNQAPKFPTPHNLFFLLRYWKRTQKAHALSMVEKTLEAMARGGIFDHAGYGFHRYATDREWLVPHFEKMLYDQALLSLAYVEAFQATGREEYREVAKKILTYVQRDLTSPEGGFFSAEDADSEGVEGKFYVWTEEEIRQHLDTETADLFVKIFGVRPEGNFLEESTREKTGTNILHLPVPLDQMAAQAGLPEVHVREKMQDALNMLFKIREGRIHPFKDDKILTDWNGLMIAAFARASQVLAEPAYGLAAKKAADFVLKTLRDERGRLLHRYREGDPGIPGLVDDYAFMVWGLIELYQATFDAAFLKEALALTQDMLTWFWDQDRGGLFFAPSDGDALIVRKKELYDGAVPSGNSLALCNLLRLARLTGDSGLEDRAIQLGRAFAKTVAAMPSAYTHFLTGVDFALGPTWEVVIAGRPGGADTMQMIEALRSRFLPNMVALLRPVDVSSSDLQRLAPFTVPYRDQGGVAAAYVCTGNACRSPTVDPNQMLKMLEE